ncbi:hypothetical protein [Chryseobacterium oryctis]|uniref:C1q domain-containing protein n=1 Tax=Chryseobacterium oryctis TaxID=2952618 RepID=A0ABT3HRN9_9FLAO|nr:hypothetical protein [Chryseobacterium oryctis]MCW3162409.1 hypothetical protein [Chryseobacterium oryctis]
MKKIFLMGCLWVCTPLFSQIGVNTSTPKASFDIVAKNPTGTSSTPEGLLVPRVNRERAQSMTDVATSTLIYINGIASGTQAGTAANIDSVGYYYFNGSVWVKLNAGTITDKDTNLYNSNGTLSGDRIVTQGDNTLAFRSNAVNGFSVDGITFSVDAANNRVGLGTSTPAERLDVQGTGLISGRLGVGTSTPAAKLDVQGGGLISGNLGVGVTDPQNKLDVDGNARFRSVTSGNLGDNDRYLGITSDGVLKKFNITLPSLALYATSTQTITRNADNTFRPLAIQSTDKINNEYIVRVNNTTFKAVKAGIYTIEVWGNFSEIPVLNEGGGADGRLGVALQLTAGGNTVSLIGSRWNGATGTSNITKTVILSANATIEVKSALSRGANEQYKEAPGSTIFITYTAL